MGLFGSNNPFDEPLGKLTNEMNTDTDWGALLALCDKVKTSSKGPQDFCNAIFNKLVHKIPHVSMQALTVLDTCVNNCGKEFHKEMASQNFTDNLREFLYTYKNPKVTRRMRYLVRKWAEEFKDDPDLSHFVSFYYYQRGEGMEFPDAEEDGDSKKSKTEPVSTDPNMVSSQQEADDIAKAIEASLKEEEQKKKTATSVSSSLYPSMLGGPTSTSTPYAAASYASSAPTSIVSRDKKKMVKALYDFEAAEDNELTFHSGDLIVILDDSDVNWWKGEGAHGVGLFPANFVTADLSVEPEPEVGSSSKKRDSVSFSDTTEVKEIVSTEPVLEISEELIDETLVSLQSTDPENQLEDSPILLQKEETCKQMERLIDHKLEEIDRKHLEMTLLNEKILDSLKMYDSLMKEMPAYVNPQLLKMNMAASGMTGPSMQQQLPPGGIVMPNYQQQAMYMNQGAYILDANGQPLPQMMMNNPNMTTQSYNPMYQQQQPQMAPGSGGQQQMYVHVQQLPPPGVSPAQSATDQPANLRQVQDQQQMQQQQPPPQQLQGTDYFLTTQVFDNTSGSGSGTFQPSAALQPNHVPTGALSPSPVMMQQYAGHSY